VIADAHEGLKHAVAKVLGATSQRCRVHWMRNALAHVPIGLCPIPRRDVSSADRGQHSMVAAALRQAFLQPDQAAAGQTWRQVADQLRPRPRWPLASVPSGIG
jgi:putative transposase